MHPVYLDVWPPMINVTDRPYVLTFEQVMVIICATRTMGPDCWVVST